MSEINGHAIAQALFGPPMLEAEAKVDQGKSAYHEAGHAVSVRQVKANLWKAKIGVLVRPYIHLYFRLLNKGHDT